METEKWGKFDEKDIEIAISMGLGATQAEAGVSVGLSNQAVSKRVTKTSPRFYSHFLQLAEIVRKRMGADRQVEWQESMEDQYFSLWKESFKQVDAAIKDGDIRLASATLKDIMNHKVGMPTRKITVQGKIESTHTHEISASDLGDIAGFLSGHRQNLLGGAIDAEEAELCD